MQLKNVLLVAAIASICCDVIWSIKLPDYRCGPLHHWVEEEVYDWMCDTDGPTEYTVSTSAAAVEGGWDPEYLEFSINLGPIANITVENECGLAEEDSGCYQVAVSLSSSADARDAFPGQGHFGYVIWICVTYSQEAEVFYVFAIDKGTTSSFSPATIAALASAFSAADSSIVTPADVDLTTMHMFDRAAGGETYFQATAGGCWYVAATKIFLGPPTLTLSEEDYHTLISNATIDGAGASLPTNLTGIHEYPCEFPGGTVRLVFGSYGEAIAAKVLQLFVLLAAGLMLKFVMI